MNKFNNGSVIYTVGDIERLQAENKALRASIPKIKADAVREAVNFASSIDFEGENFCHVYDLYIYADKLESQAAKD